MGPSELEWLTDNSNGTITDNLTGLIWLKNANCPNGTRTWQEALDFVVNINNGTNNCGDTSKSGSNQTDWRLPNIRELFSLVDFRFSGPAISNAAGTANGTPNDPFSNLVSGVSPGVPNYWSSTTGATSGAWVVTFSSGFAFVDAAGKLGSGFVLAVRGGL